MTTGAPGGATIGAGAGWWADRVDRCVLGWPRQAVRELDMKAGRPVRAGYHAARSTCFRAAAKPGAGSRRPVRFPRLRRVLSWELLAHFTERLTQGGDLSCQDGDCLVLPTAVLVPAV